MKKPTFELSVLVPIIILTSNLQLDLGSAWADSVIETVQVESSPTYLEYDPDDNNLYVANSDSDTVSVIDGTSNTVIQTIEVGNGLFALEYNPSNENIYVSDVDPGTVYVIDTTHSSIESKTIYQIIEDIIQNPLDVSNSIASANQIRDIMTDENRNNDQLVCDLIDSENEYASNIRDILNC